MDIIGYAPGKDSLKAQIHSQPISETKRKTITSIITKKNCFPKTFRDIAAFSSFL